MTFSTLVVAAGSGARAGAGDAKQWRTLAGKPVLRWSVETLLAAGSAPVIVIVAPGMEARAAEALAGLQGWRTVAGGATRAASVRAGLADLAPADDDIVLIHDAARPLLPQAVIGDLLDAIHNGAEGALPALPVADTLKRPTDGGVQTIDREGLWRAQTPQAFRAGALASAWACWPADQVPTDDAAVLEHAGGDIRLIDGDVHLMKLTYPEDFDMAERLIPRQTRVGSGYDVHRWGPGGSVWLCGIEVPHDRTLIGHSDADAGLHALTDAILGALSAGDIGDHFPPSDPQWKGASSDRFLTHAAGLVQARGGRIVHVDVTLICERPKVKPHREAMRERIAGLLSLPLDAVSVKATTTEGLGFTGRDEGLAAQAVATIELPA
jgi:2-C-methyl-D-erythritol 4-phosphate cytidylyltransferase/2-C-methyl-D-erythritol 2,4-cyclodiphosphate synthase